MSDPIEERVSERDLAAWKGALTRLETARAAIQQAQVEALRAEGAVQGVEGLLKDAYGLAAGDQVNPESGVITRKAAD